MLGQAGLPIDGWQCGRLRLNWTVISAATSEPIDTHRESLPPIAITAMRNQDHDRGDNDKDRH